MNAQRTHPPHTTVEEAEEVTGFAVAASARGVEIAVALLLALLVCPPLLILVVVVVVPLVAIAILVSLVVAAFAAPYLLVRHLRGHRDAHAHLLAGRLRHAAHALHDLLPHRIVIAARQHARRP
jgi:multidrug efflux pump subunit AcrB